jgi:hypothetical protein
MARNDFNLQPGELAHMLGKTVFIILMGALFLFTASRNLDLLQRVVPHGQEQIIVLGLVAIEGGIIAWLIYHKVIAKNAVEHVIAFLMIVLSIFGVGIGSGMDMYITLVQNGFLQQNAWVYTTVFIAIICIFVLHVMAYTATHLVTNENLQKLGLSTRGGTQSFAPPSFPAQRSGGSLSSMPPAPGMIAPPFSRGASPSTHVNMEQPPVTASHRIAAPGARGDSDHFSAAPPVTAKHTFLTGRRQPYQNPVDVAAQHTRHIGGTGQSVAAMPIVAPPRSPSTPAPSERFSPPFAEMGTGSVEESAP